MTELSMGTEPAATISALQRTLARAGTVCVALAASDPTALIEKAAAALADTTFLEFRLDYLPDPATALPLLQTFLRSHPAVTAIATCRRLAEGGHFAGTVEEELALLLRAVHAGCHIVDLPIAEAEALPPSGLAPLRSSGAAILLSHHDFHATPDLAPILDRALRLHPDLIKIVPTASTLSDNLPLLDLLASHTSPPALVGISMGASGLPSRILGVRSGSAFTFAAAGEADATAPGQLTARALLQTFRLPDPHRSTRIFGVAGNPLHHSLSPTMLNAAFASTEIDAVYLPLQTSDVSDLLRLVHQLPVHGLSVTMPLKEQVLAHLDEVDPLCRHVGACNTIHRTPEGRLHGFNTDVFGITTPLQKRLGSLHGARVLVLGAGGAARAAVFGLLDQRADVFLHNRTPAAADRLAGEAGARTVSRDSLRHTTFDVIVNATPLGMLGHTAASPLLAEELRGGLVFDLVYNPLQTPLLQLATALGLPVISGYEMFVYQGARQFEIWTGEPAPEQHMLHVVLNALERRFATTSSRPDEGHAAAGTPSTPPVA